MIYVDIFISNKWMIINVTYDHSMWCYHSLTFLPNPKPPLPKGNHGVTMWQLHLALSSLTACWFPVPMFQWQKLRANTWHGFQTNGKNTSHFGARLNILRPGKHWFYCPENGHGTYKLTLSEIFQTCIFKFLLIFKGVLSILNRYGLQALVASEMATIRAVAIYLSFIRGKMFWLRL